MAQPTLMPRAFAQKWGDNETKEKAASRNTSSTRLGRGAFLEVTDPWDAESLIRAKYLEPSQDPVPS